VGEAKNPAQMRLRDWPMFQGSSGSNRKRTSTALDGKPLPKISELLVSHLQGTAVAKLAWLREQKAAGRLDGDDPDEVAEAEALLAMLARLAEAKLRRQHLDALLDEGLKASFPASDPISVGHFTGAEAWARA
jgi:hypothetical protein